MMDQAIRRNEARAAIANVLDEYNDVFGPDESAMSMLDSWVIATQWMDVEEGNHWTCIGNSGCSWPTRIGLLRIGLHYEEGVNE